MIKNILPEISQIEINEAKGDAWDFLFLFIDRYENMLHSEGAEEIVEQFNPEQHTLLAFNYLYAQVTNGGFLQLIQNGYGEYVFNNSNSATLKNWGATQIAAIMDSAEKIYEKHKTELEKERTIEEFSKLYEEFTGFETLDNKFYEVMDSEVEIIKSYVENNLNQFAIVK